MAARKSDAGALQLIGWSFASFPRRTLVKLKEPDGVTYIDVKRVVGAPEYFERLSDADQAKVMAMVTGTAA